MKKNKLNIVVSAFIVILSVFVSCKSIPTNSFKESNHKSPEQFYYDSLSVEQINKLLIGKWEWDHSRIVSRGVPPPDNIITPATVGYSMQRFFNAKNTVGYFKNNELIETHSYTVKKFKVLPEDQSFITEIYIDEYPAQLLFFHPDTMMIGNGWMDGIDDYFIRK